MHSSIYDLKTFYNGKVGRVVRRVMQERIRRFWPDVRGLSILGCGYAVPYMRIYRAECKRMMVAMSPEQGASHWPHDGLNCVLLSQTESLPFETNSLDRVLLIHDLEFAADPAASMQEVWRVLKSNGRALFIVPNRAGLWTHADWAPFGHGLPYSLSQLCHRLKEQRFVVERSDEALFMPPLKFSPFLKSAGLFEYIGSHFLPFTAGVHMVEVGKQLYAKIDPPRGSKVSVKVPDILIPKPATRHLSKDYLDRHRP